MPSFENHALARRQVLDRAFYFLLQLPVPKASFGVRFGGIFFERFHAVDDAIGRFHHRGFLFSNLSFPQLVQADVGYDPVKPGMKTAIETEGMEIAIDPQTSLLIHISRI